MKTLYFEGMIDELLWYSFERDIQFTKYTAGHWANMKKAEHFSQSWMTAKESLTLILEEKKICDNYRDLFYRDLWF